MSTITELNTASKETEAKRQSSALGTPAQEAVSEQDGGFLGRAFGGAPGELPADGAARFLRNPTLSHSANGGLRAISLKRAQQTFGNRFAQSAVAQLQRKSATGRLLQRKCSCDGTCASCQGKLADEEEPKLLQRQTAQTDTAGSPFDANVVPSNSIGQVLDRDTRSFMEPRFGNDFSDVRVHTDSLAAHSAHALQAEAYATGRDIYFAAGRYAPETTSGQRLLAHELAHTIQQRGSSAPTEEAVHLGGGVIVARADGPLEQEADRAADLAVNGNGAFAHPSTTTASAPTVQRQETPSNKAPEQPGKFPPQEEPKHGREKEDEDKEKAVKGGLKAAGEFSARFWDEFSNSDVGKSVLTANKREWQSVIKFFDDFWSNAFGKVVLSGLGAGAAPGLFAAGRAARDAEAAPASSAEGATPVSPVPKDEKFVALELHWDFVTPPAGVTLKTPWLDLPKIGGKSSGGSSTLPPAPQFIRFAAKIPRICTPIDPQGDAGEAAARDAQIYSWLLWKQEQERKRMDEIVRLSIRAPDQSWQPGRMPKISGSALSPLTPLFKRAPGAHEREGDILRGNYAPLDSRVPEVKGEHGVVQRKSGRATRIQKFASQEHRELGHEATGGARTDLNIGTDSAPEYLTYGEMVSLAGDYFENLKEMRSLASSDTGREQLRWARWQALSTGGEPAVSKEAKQAVLDRYYNLAARNIPHFSAGGTARNEYQAYHRQAVELAFRSGINGNQALFDEARTTEAFGHHYLTDMFAGGHVRTPRAAIRAWYQSHYPASINQFISYMAAHMSAYLKRKHNVADFFGQVPDQPALETTIRELGGTALSSFSLGDIVSLAFHNRDNFGLKVISDVNEAGTAVSGGFRFEAKGDNQLGSSPKTRDMALAAMRASLGELEAMRKAGAATTGGRPVSSPGPRPDFSAEFQRALTEMSPFAAERYLPREEASAGNVVMLWEWGTFNAEMRAAVEAAIRSDVVPVLRKKAAALTDKNKRDALEELAGHMDTEGIRAIEAAVGAAAGP